MCLILYSIHFFLSTFLVYIQYVDDLDEYKIVVDWIKSNFTGKDADNALGLLNAYFSEYAEKVSKTNEMLGQEGLSIQEYVFCTLLYNNLFLSKIFITLNTTALC